MVINILSFCCAFLDVLESAAGTHINQLCSRNELPVNCGCTDSQGVLTGKTGPTHTYTQRRLGQPMQLHFWQWNIAFVKKYRFLATNIKVDKVLTLNTTAVLT